jgi:hypothetical protein
MNNPVPKETFPQSATFERAPEIYHVYPVKDISAATYRRTVETLRRQSAKLRGEQPDEPVYVSIQDVANDFMARTDLKPSTVMARRSALLWYAKSLQDPSADEIIRTLQAFRPSTLPRNRVAGPPRSIPEDHYRELITELGSLRSRWAHRAQLWIKAGLATGLRPVEWLSARWEDDTQTILLVDSAKEHVGPPAFLRPQFLTARDLATAEPALPQTQRAFEADDLDEEDLINEPAVRRIPVTSTIDRRNINYHFDELHRLVPLGGDEVARRELYRHYYTQTRNAINRACRAVWGGDRFYSLYTMRSQFNANQKAALGPAAAATLMGHSGPNSPAQSHYGKGNQAHSSFKGLRGGLELPKPETLSPSIGAVPTGQQN